MTAEMPVMTSARRNAPVRRHRVERQHRGFVAIGQVGARPRGPLTFFDSESARDRFFALALGAGLDLELGVFGMIAGGRERRGVRDPHTAKSARTAATRRLAFAGDRDRRAVGRDRQLDTPSSRSDRRACLRLLTSSAFMPFAVDRRASGACTRRARADWSSTSGARGTRRFHRRPSIAL